MPTYLAFFIAALLAACVDDKQPSNQPVVPTVPASAEDAPPAPVEVAAATPLDAAVASPTDASSAADGAVTNRAQLKCGKNELLFQRVKGADGVQLNVGCRGAGPAIVLLHGYPEYHGTWLPLIPLLVAQGYQVVAPDLRGYNLSDKPTEVADYALEKIAEDVRAVILATGQERVLLVGHDWGGITGWLVAHRYPELLRGYVGMSAPHPDTWMDKKLDPVQAEASSKYVPVLASAVGGLPFWVGYFDYALGPHMSDVELEGYHRAWDQPNAQVSMNNYFRANVSPENKLPRNAHVNVRSLVMWGELDEFTTTSQLKYIPAFVKDLEIVTWPDVDHWIQHQHVDELAQRIVAFDRKP